MCQKAGSLRATDGRVQRRLTYAVIQALSETAGAMTGRPPIVVGRAVREMSFDPIIERAR
jgi:hypothetical protein